MSARRDRCRFCPSNVDAIVRTAGGVSRVCAAHISSIPNPVVVTALPVPTPGPDMNYATAQNRDGLATYRGAA